MFLPETCRRCGGAMFPDWDGATCLLCGRERTAPQVAEAHRNATREIHWKRNRNQAFEWFSDEERRALGKRCAEEARSRNLRNRDIAAKLRVDEIALKSALYGPKMPRLLLRVAEHLGIECPKAVTA